MNRRRILVTGIVVLVAYYVMAFFVHGLWLGPTYSGLAGKVWRPQAELYANAWIVHLTTVVFYFVFAYLFARGTGEAVGARERGTASSPTCLLASRRSFTPTRPTRSHSI